MSIRIQIQTSSWASCEGSASVSVKIVSYEQGCDPVVLAVGSSGIIALSADVTPEVLAKRAACNAVNILASDLQHAEDILRLMGLRP